MSQALFERADFSRCTCKPHANCRRVSSTAGGPGTLTSMMVAASAKLPAR